MTKGHKHGAKGKMTTENDTPDFGEHTEAVLAWVEQREAGLRSKRDELLGTTKALQSKLKTYEGFDPEEYQALKTAAQAAAEKKEKEKGNFEAILSKRQEQFTLELQAREQKYSNLASKLQKTHFERETITALNAQGGVPKLLMPVIERRTKTEIDDEGAVHVHVLDEDGFVVEGKTVADLVADLKADTDYGNAFRSGAASGGGAAGAAKAQPGVENPWDRAAGTWNMSKQGILERTDPVLAAKLKAAAGK